MRYLVEHKDLDINAADSAKDTPLILAAKVGNINILKILCETKTVKKDEVNEFGENALMSAAKVGNLEAVKYLLRSSSSPSLDQKNELGFTAIHLATIGGHLEIIELLEQNWSERYPTKAIGKTKVGRTLLMLAALSGKEDVVKFWLTFKSQKVYREQIDANVTDTNGKTALMLAASKGATEIVKHLCEQTDVDVNISDRDNGHNSLMLACVNGHDETAIVLLDHNKTDIKVTDHLGKNALFLATEKSAPKCVKALLDCERFSKDIGTVVNAPTKTGDKTALTVTDDRDLRVDLIKAGGYDVRTILQDQKELR